MIEVGFFEKVSWEQFLKDYKSRFPWSKDYIEFVYENIKMPQRATKDSMGYDFFAPFEIMLNPYETIVIPTGIRFKSIIEGWGLLLYPRSGLGFKYRLQLNNTVGVIDADYYYSDNEGHIFIKITNDTNEEKYINIKMGEGFAQGILTPFGLVVGDNVTEIRNGGFGSTTEK